MGNLFSFFSLNNVEINEALQPDKTELNSDEVAQIVSSITFSDSDTDNYIGDPDRGDPCALYLEGINRNWSNDDFKKFLTKNHIRFTKARKSEGVSYGTIYFDSKDDRRESYRTLTSVRFDNMILYVVPLTKSFSLTQAKCDKLRNRNKSTKSIVDRVTPWLAIEYSEQIRQKVFKYSKILDKILPRGSPLTEVLQMDNLRYYYNDVELTIGWNCGRKIAVGFNLGSKKDDTIAEISDCVNVPKIAIQISERLRKFVLTSGLPPYNRLKNVGVWKCARIRQNLSDDVMLIIMTYGPLNEAMQDKLKSEFHDMRSLYYADTCQNESFGHKYKLHHLRGDEFLAETISGCIYPIRPTTVFPNSVHSFEKIIQQVISLGSFDRQTLVVDVDSGFGIYAFPISKVVSKVVAFEPNEDLFESLKAIKTQNKISNVDARNGNFEDMISAIKPTRNQKVVAVIHPPHCGIRKKALLRMGKIPYLKMIIFVTSNAEQIVNDVDEIFINPKDENISQFYVDSYICVDTAPHTDRATVVLTLVK